MGLCAEGPEANWIQLFPAGQVITGNDGRSWRLSSPSQLIRDFDARGLFLPIDYEHQIDERQSGARGPVRAAGWIKALRHTPDTGVWGLVEWTEAAQKMIRALEYRYISPAFHFDQKSNEITRIIGAGLVQRPNLQLKALAREEGPVMSNSPLSRIAVALGLEADADETAILTALNREAVPDPARFVPIEAVRELVAERAQSKAIASEELATARVNEATRAGYLTPAMHGWAVSLCRANPESFDDFLRCAAPAYAHLFQPTQLPALNREGNSRASTAEEAAVYAQLGLKGNGDV